MIEDGFSYGQATTTTNGVVLGSSPGLALVVNCYHKYYVTKFYCRSVRRYGKVAFPI